MFHRNRQVSELQRRQARIQLVALQQLRVRADGDDAAVIEHDDAVGFEDGREAVRDDDASCDVRISRSSASCT